MIVSTNRIVDGHVDRLEVFEAARELWIGVDHPEPVEADRKRDQAPDPRTLPPATKPPVKDGPGSETPVRRLG